ncbi:MAG: glutamate--cysteine ligase [Lapillicoccus sp.]
MRTVGVEEELLLVDPETGHPLAAADAVLRVARSRGEVPGGMAGERSYATGRDAADAAAWGALEAELQREQIETHTPAVVDMQTLRDQLHDWRSRASSAAAASGAALAALGTSPLAFEAHLVPKPRYHRMAARFGLTAHEVLTCGCHVHVEVGSREEGVTALDGIRAWLPVVLALSANSPFWDGRDSGYASYRTQVQGRWPLSGPTDHFGSVAAYDRCIEEMLATGVILDEGMVYFHARLSHAYPTVEIRVADVCTDVSETVVVAALCRALVDVAVEDAGPRSEVPTAILRLATWQASRDGLTGHLLEPTTHRPAPASEVVAALLDHTRDALQDNGDLALVTTGVARLLEAGTGAGRQRAALSRRGHLADAVMDAVGRTGGPR